MSDVWSTMGGACEEGEGLHLTVGEHAVLELVDPDDGDAAGARGRRERRARLDPPAARGLAAAALPLRRPRPRVDLAVRVRAQLAADPHRRPPRRHAARPGGERLPAGDRRDPGQRVGAGPPLRGRRGRPDRTAAAPVRGGAGGGGPQRHRRPRSHAALRRPLRSHAARARVAARGRAQDPNRPPNGARATRCRTRSRPC